MNKIETEIITIFLSTAFALAGIFNYIASAKPYLPLWIVSFICLLATVIIDIVDRVVIEKTEFDGIEQEKEE